MVLAVHTTLGDIGQLLNCSCQVYIHHISSLTSYHLNKMAAPLVIISALILDHTPRR